MLLYRVIFCYIPVKNQILNDINYIFKNVNTNLILSCLRKILINKYLIIAFANCVNDAFCAARAVQGYMTKYGQVSGNLRIIIYKIKTIIYRFIR